MTTAMFRVLHVHRLTTLGVTIAAVDILSGVVVPGARAYAMVSGMPVEMVVRSVALEGGRSRMDGTVTLQIELSGAEPPDAVEGAVFEVR
ncbi:hypothetical protein D7V77_11180 [Corallococcus sp. CA041A]|uniref:hypothetical protein n=1 Tax=Corallococcus TaxID=83461 RepID=UPI000EA1B515|nr:hypothetical protein [Corallococcus sp. CA041A]RKH27597.1 hypothetical protein D7V77_11180 [Corallococcus sp. CA041A]